MSEKSDEQNTKFGAPYLLHSINVIWFIMALFCVPVWWYTTTVTRFDIPYDRIQNAHERSLKLKSEHKSLMTLADNYDILLTLILPDVYADWNIETSSKHVTDFTSKISSVADFSISSQIIYHPGDLDLSRKNSGGGTKWGKSDLSNVINALESHLQSNLNPNSKLIQLVAYVPPKQISPLILEDNKKRAILPDWGLFSVLDVDYENLESKILDVEEIMKGFSRDLEVLFDVKNLHSGRLIQNIQAASNSLSSLSQLLQRVRNMVINEKVSAEILESVDALETALDELENSNKSLALKFSRVAYQKSENAFFDTSLLELLYFPQDQKFAIYIPLFLPVGIPILFGIKEAIKYFKQQRLLKIKTD